MKALVIRFSSIGDVTQSLSIPSHIKSLYPNAEIHFLTRSEFTQLMENNPSIQKIWSLDRKKGFGGLLKISRLLRAENFTHIYDAHNNMRTFVLKILIPAQHKLTRPMQRIKRFLLIRFKINLFEKPFSGQRDLLKPLEQWGIAFRLPPPPQIFLNSDVQKKASNILQKHSLQKFTVLAPSAAHALKRWPLKHWKKLIELNPQEKFVVLAGPSDSFTTELNVFSNVVNLTGQTSLLESAALIAHAEKIVSNDTGLLHFAEQLGKNTIALMGPAPFGFPSRPTTLILERHLKCRPCSKHGQGPCVNPNFHECLESILPLEVSEMMKRL